MLDLTYMALVVLGCGYIALAVLLGHVGDFGGNGAPGVDGYGGEGTAAGHSQMEYGVDASGHGGVSAGDGTAPAAFHFPFFSPLALATLFASIGAYGLIAKFGLEVDDGTSLLLSVPAALVTAYAVTYVAFRLAASSRGSSQIRLQDIAGASAEVITPIPPGGLGEVAVMVAGQRFTGPARETGGQEVPRGTVVRVVRMVGPTLLVETGGKEGGSGDA